MMTEEQADKAHEVWEFLYSVLRTKVHDVMRKNNLNEYQREYVLSKLHEELRYW